MTDKPKRTRAPISPKIRAITQVQRILSGFPNETQRTIVDFVLKSLEEEASQPAGVAAQ